MFNAFQGLLVKPTRSPTRIGSGNRHLRRFVWGQVIITVNAWKKSGLAVELSKTCQQTPGSSATCIIYCPTFKLLDPLGGNKKYLHTYTFTQYYCVYKCIYIYIYHVIYTEIQIYIYRWMCIYIYIQYIYMCVCVFASGFSIL